MPNKKHNFFGFFVINLCASDPGKKAEVEEKAEEEAEAEVEESGTEWMYECMDV